MAKNGNILNTISSLYRSLTKTEKKIADAILLNPDLAVQAPLAEIAAHLEVGEATFVRFCRTLGFKGFSDFKLELSIELATKDGWRRITPAWRSSTWQTIRMPSLSPTAAPWRGTW